MIAKLKSYLPQIKTVTSTFGFNQPTSLFNTPISSRGGE
jgi:hypothetical protein